MSDSKKAAGALRALATMHNKECPAYKALSEMAENVETRDGKGPAQVATASYRVNYDSIFGARQEVGQA